MTQGSARLRLDSAPSVPLSPILGTRDQQRSLHLEPLP